MAEPVLFTTEKIYDEPISMIDVSAAVNLFGLRLGVGSKLILHEVPPRYHKHEREIDVIVTGDAAAGFATPTTPTPSVNLLRQAFAEWKLSAGTKIAYYFHDDFPLSLRQTREHTSEFVQLATASAGVRSFLHDRTQFAIWNPLRHEVTVYNGTGGKVTSPPQHIISTFARRWTNPVLRGIGMAITETVGVNMVSGRQLIYRFVPRRQ